MRIAAAALILLGSTTGSAQAFVVSRNPCFATGRDVSIRMEHEKPRKMPMSSTEQTSKKPLTSSDIINRARQAVGVPREEESPKLFEDDILNDMRQCLLKLERRVKEGPGSLNSAEVDEFEAAMRRIVDEMNEKLAAGTSPAVRKGASTAVTAEIVAPVETIRPPPQMQTSSAPPAASVVPASEPVVTDSATPSIPTELKTVQLLEPETMKSKVLDTSNDEAPPFTGKGGLGLAQGTRNTYVIPGMDEMSPEEYRAALQKSVSDRQARRRELQGSNIGNRASANYLEQLKGGSEVAREDKDESSSSNSGRVQITPPIPVEFNSDFVPSTESIPSETIYPTSSSSVSGRPVSSFPAEYEQTELSEAHKIVNKVLDTSNDEGPTHAGKGGLGLAPGTRNTYVIPGMGEMSPKEYRTALQKTVSDRQSERRKAMGNVVGNRAALQYLDQLGYGGASSNWATNEDDEEQEKS